MNATYPTGRQSLFALPALALALWLITPAPSSGQSLLFQKSQRATITQHIAETQVSVDYSRPSLRGRDQIFGPTVIWGELWTPGANMATVLGVSEDVKLDGNHVPAGRWSVWAIPSQVGPWEILLDPRDSLFHEQRPKLDQEGQIRFPVETHRVDPVETLTWSFPRVERDGATLQMAWSTTMVSLELEVDPAMPVTTIPAEEAALYVGEWGVDDDPEAETEREPPILQVRHASDGSLRVRIPPELVGERMDNGEEAQAADERVAGAEESGRDRERAEARRRLSQIPEAGFEMMLVPRAPGIFMQAWALGVELYDIYEIYWEFEIEDERAVRLTTRGGNDEIWWTASHVSDEVPTVATITLPPEVLERFVGVFYEPPPGPATTISLDGDQLIAEVTGGGRYLIHPTAETEFIIEGTDDRISFMLEADGPASALTWHVRGQEFEALRK